MKYRYEKKYTIAYVLSHIVSDLRDGEGRVEIDGDLMSVGSQRYRLFRKSIVCRHCGLKGEYFYKEKHLLHDPYHFNLYGIDAEGNEILFTKDHIQPKSKGGSNGMKNYQTMCQVCNTRKGNREKVIANPNRKKAQNQKQKRIKLNLPIWVSETRNLEGETIELELYTKPNLAVDVAKHKGCIYLVNNYWYDYDSRELTHIYPKKIKS